MLDVLVAIIAALAGAGIGYFARHSMGRKQVGGIEQLAQQRLEAARREADAIRREGDILVKGEMVKARDEFETSTKNRRKELADIEQRIFQRETNLDRKVTVIEKKEQTLDDRTVELEKEIGAARQDRADLQTAVAEEREKVQQIAKLTQEEARRLLLTRVEKEVHTEMGTMIRRMHDEAKETAEREAQRVVTMAIQRYASSHVSDVMTSTVTLPSDDMKGRIIGRDGRNIRALEAATGINVLIDDTPDAVVISGFDPVRREIAKRALEHLVADGRIHPARIEEIVLKVTEDMNETIRLAGEEASYATGVQGASPELLRMIGKLKFRTSFTQNVLQHSIEVANLMGIMAGELGLDPSLAKRIGLFHDIGKAMDHEVEGGHAVIGADLLKRQGELQIVVNAVASHHEEVPAESLYAYLAAAADAISSSRLGARSETTEIYIKRLEKLESISNSFPGVQKSYAIQAGREVRVLVEPTKVDDNAAMILARDISKKIEAELQYPGQIRILVIRETRCIEYAR